MKKQKSPLHCRIFGHAWDKYSGYEGIKAAIGAQCLKCRKYAKDLKDAS